MDVRPYVDSTEVPGLDNASGIAFRQVTPGPSLGYAMALGAAVVWGSLGIFAKFIYRYEIDPVVLVSLRASIAFLTLLAILLVGGRSKLHVQRNDLLFFAVFGLVGVALNYMLYFEALKRTTVTTAVILLYTSPVFVTLGAAVFFKEALTKVKVAALMVTFTGCFLVAGGHDPRLLALNPAGTLLGLGSAITYGSYTLLSKHALKRYTSWTAVLYAFGFGSLFLLCFAAGRLHQVRALPLQAWILILGLAWGPTLVAYALYVLALHYIEASHAGVICMAEPASTAVLAFIILGERLVGWQLAGAALVLAGVFLIQVRSRERKVPSEFHKGVDPMG